LWKIFIVPSILNDSFARAEVIFIQCLKSHSMPLLLLRFPLRNLLLFWWAYLYMLLVFSVLQPSIFFLCSLCLLF
jgi:hypothetical protein